MLCMCMCTFMNKLPKKNSSSDVYSMFNTDGVQFESLYSCAACDCCNIMVAFMDVNTACCGRVERFSNHMFIQTNMRMLTTL